MQNINPTHNRNRRSLFYLWIVGVPGVFGGLSACALVALLSQFPLLGNFNTIGMACLGIMAVVAVLGGAFSAYRGLTLARDNDIAYQVGEYLKQAMNDPNFTFIRNVSRRGLGYIDAVLIGPPGALVFRTVNYDGTWRNELAEWKIRDPKSGKVRSAPSNPSRECARDVYALRRYFSKRSLTNVPVYGIVVFHNPSAILQGEGSVVPISQTHLLYDIMQREFLEEPQRIPPEVVKRAIASIVEG